MAWLLIGSIVTIGLVVGACLYFGIIAMNAALGTMIE